MKNLSIVVLSFFAFTMASSDNIYDYAIPRIEGDSQPLSDFQGRKILVVVLPIEQTPSSDSLLFSLDSLSQEHSNSVVIVAVPAYEDGFSTSQKEELRQWYRSKLSNQIIVSDGLYTRKSSGAQQHDLFAWLTKFELNESFDMDVEGPGFKFFVSEEGELYGVYRSHTRVSSVAVDKALGM